MSNKKGKIEFGFKEGDKEFKFTFGDDVDTSKIIEIVNSLRTPPSSSQNASRDGNLQDAKKNDDLDLADLSIKEKLLMLIKQNYRYGSFASRDVQELYESEYGEEVKLSTISTYLTRLYEDGMLDRQGSRKRREFRLIKFIETTPIQEQQ